MILIIKLIMNSNKKNVWKIKNYTKEYNSIMHFSRNKPKYIHRWFPFVEGYSTDFIDSILKENSSIPIVCLDPFSGSGTTALELQKRKIECYSIEVNPFMHLLSTVKLKTDYDLKKTIKYYNQVKTKLKSISLISSLASKTIKNPHPISCFIFIINSSIYSNV